jgi:long-chain acyl-CoA synthetase
MSFLVQLEQSILDFAEALRAAGAEPDQTVALFADNSHRWLIADQGVNIMQLQPIICKHGVTVRNVQVVWES